MQSIPGYGFLSENEIFAQQVIDAGMIFIGPLSTCHSRSWAVNSQPRLPLQNLMFHWYQARLSPSRTSTKQKKSQRKIGYPILIKASAGGGGKGMRIVEDEKSFEEQMERAVSEATSAFGDGSVFIEKYITKAPHIEFQIFGDQHGNIVHLFERECSIQRRHQKVVEEAPSSVLTPEIRQAMGRAAVDVARSCGYYNAGTVEFILDDKRNFYFLEMNTRLQVEHPVTEEVTGLDLGQTSNKNCGRTKTAFSAGRTFHSRTCYRSPGLCRRSCQ
jgi:propionyl-CoA carboxylase alpha chain